MKMNQIYIILYYLVTYIETCFAAALPEEPNNTVSFNVNLVPLKEEKRPAILSDMNKLIECLHLVPDVDVRQNSTIEERRKQVYVRCVDSVFVGRAKVINKPTSIESRTPNRHFESVRWV